MATGCGDTYMAGYLYQRLKGAGIQDAGEFAAAMATLKLGSSRTLHRLGRRCTGPAGKLAPHHQPVIPLIVRQ